MNYLKVLIPRLLLPTCVRGTLSLHPGGQRVAGDERLRPWPVLTPARPLPWGA